MNIPLPFIGLGYTIAVITVIAILFMKKKMNDKAGLFFLIISVFVSGILLGGLPNPIAPIQQIAYGLGHGKVNPVHVAGILILLLTVLFSGRIFCGYVCPLGAIQELMSRFRKKQVKPHTEVSGKVRAVILIGFIIVGIFSPLYIKIDPFGAFSLNPSLYQAAVFLVIAITAISVYRPWCAWICPFGALASLVSRFSLLKIGMNENCNDCGACKKKCPTSQPYRGSDMSECYYCGRCFSVCKKDALEAKINIAGKKGD
ncbi:hypothetical protein CUJ83_04545 [Methanocella sp. CWC-04]|uniref:4Fe-4S ferredoxin-type domain-containing protein n=1 Tax=Methanooceanicella nereidis TaxID=2052831 RepID=A0AAP2RDV7_9EURY|nr:4Fe-4S binding protein [Methanocella sp. CWC-04]MCD1294265.1 hypothetical protein [Methanocella sp. CWC-04]